jgi:glycerol-3-phosphate acyltransferase PlsY
MLTLKEAVWVLASYCLGCFTAGYYWVRLRTGQDIRQQGSGTVGARNAGRVLGPAGFMATFLLDFSKGALAVAGARYLDLGGGAVVACILAVVLGHAFPVQLRFHGGKGVAVSLGALLVYDPEIIAILLGVFLPAFVLFRNFSLAGLLAFALAPLAVFFWGMGKGPVAAMCLLAVLVLLLHRRDIREEYARVFSRGVLKNVSAHKRRGTGS